MSGGDSMDCGTTHHEGCPCHEARRNAEVERLRDGIRRHYLTVTSDPHYVESVNEGVADEADERLWALLEENHDDR